MFDCWDTREALYLLNMTIIPAFTWIRSQVACIAVALFLQYFLLAQFCWSFIEAVVLYRYAVRVFNLEIKPAYLYAFAWGE